MVYEKEQELKDHYNKYPRGGTTIANPQALRSIFDMAEINISPHSNVLDLGCASGVMSDIIRREYDVNVTGVDSAFSRILIGREERPNIEYIEQDIHKFVRTTARKFDLIILGYGLKADRKPKTLIGYAKKLLNEKGIIISRTPLAFPYLAHLQVFNNKADFDLKLNPDTSIEAGRSIIAIWQ